jgi:hypothetical protein
MAGYARGERVDRREREFIAELMADHPGMTEQEALELSGGI